jgi:hypothetical protein
LPERVKNYAFNRNTLQMQVSALIICGRKILNRVFLKLDRENLHSSGLLNQRSNLPRKSDRKQVPVRALAVREKDQEYKGSREEDGRRLLNT